VSTAQTGRVPWAPSAPKPTTGGAAGGPSASRTRAQAALPGGAVVTIRAAVAYDAPAMDDLYARCSRRSLHERYPGMPPSVWAPSAARSVLVAYAADRLVGIAEITGFMPVADVGVLIREDRRRRGLGAILTRQTLHVAHLLGYREAVAFGLPDNGALRAMLGRLGLEPHTRYTGDLLVTRVPLPYLD
jgi:L-amino acid N-acyltransferase YncA